jgi:hypothetical protein
LTQLAPDVWMLKMERDKFERVYRAKLSKLGAAGVQALVQQTAGGPEGAVLLCYENLAKPGEWCHRSIWAAC